MRVISRKVLKEFAAGNDKADAAACAGQLDAWYHDVRSAT